MRMIRVLFHGCAGGFVGLCLPCLFICVSMIQLVIWVLQVCSPLFDVLVVSLNI